MPLDETGASSSATPDANLDASSTSPSDALPASSTGPDVSPASSAETPEADKAGLLAAIQSVVKVEEEPDALAPEPAKTDTPAPVEGADGKQPDAAVQDPTDQELASYSKGAQGRIKELVKARNEVRQQLEAVQPLVEQAQHFNSFVRDNDLAMDDVNLLLGLGATLRRGDFKTFLEGVRPYIAIAEQALGERLPQDLQKQVDDGFTTEEVARELAQARFLSAHAKTELDTIRQRDEAQAVEAVKSDVRTATQSWEDGIRSRDPDYSLKQDLVREFAEKMVLQRGVPQSPQQAIEYANEAYERVNQTFSKLRPAPRPTRTAPGSVHVPASASAAPTSLMEAALQGLAAARR